MRVLVVASPGDAQELMASCTKIGVDAAQVKGLAAVREAVARQRFDLVLVAESVAEAEGFEVILYIRSLAGMALVPVAFVLAGDNPALARAALLSGATEVFPSGKWRELEDFIRLYAKDDSALSSAFSGRALIVEDSETMAVLMEKVCHQLALASDWADSVDAAETLLQTNIYELVIVDVILAGAYSGAELVRRIRRKGGQNATVPVLAATGMDDPARRIELIRSGIDDFLLKPFLDEELAWRIRSLLERRSVEEGALALSSGDTSELLERLQLRLNLSRREAEICMQVIRGQPDKCIAADLGISYWTVRSHLHRIFSKVGAFNRTELTARLLEE